MKKLVTISIFLAIVLGLSVFELAVDTGRYTALTGKLEILTETLERNKDDLAAGEVASAYGEVLDEWEKADGLSMTMTNHNVIRTLGEKIAYLGAYIETDVYSDAYSTAKAIIKTVSDIKREKYPVLSNIF